MHLDDGMWTLTGTLGERFTVVRPRRGMAEMPDWEPVPAMLVRMYVADWLREPFGRAVVLDICASLRSPSLLPAAHSVQATSAFAAIFQDAAERDELRVFARRASEGSFARVSASSPPPVPLETDVVPLVPADELTWIAIQLVDSEDKPVANAPYRVTLPNWEVRSGTLDSSGSTRIDGIESGQCGVEFPGIPPEEWGATSTPGGFIHVVQAGDCLSSIAVKYGFNDWRTIYNAPENAEFRAARPSPNLIFPGDPLHIPGKEIAEPVMRPTDASHTFRLKSSPTRFRVRIVTGFPLPFAWRLVIDGATHEGYLDDGGVIDVPIRPDATAGQLVLWPNGDAAFPINWALSLGQLDPVEEASGVQARLNNLGFPCGTVDGIVGPKTAAALSAFQCAAGLPITGAIDDATRAALQAGHDLMGALA